VARDPLRLRKHLIDVEIAADGLDDLRGLAPQVEPDLLAVDLGPE
jgi:hypothetical protein